MNGPLLRSRFDRKIAGVCGGIARAYGWDPTLVRIAVLALAVFTGVGLVGYVICWVVIPEDPIGVPAVPYAGVPTQYPPYNSAPPPPPYPPADQPPTA